MMDISIESEKNIVTELIFKLHDHELCTTAGSVRVLVCWQLYKLSIYLYPIIETSQVKKIIETSTKCNIVVTSISLKPTIMNLCKLYVNVLIWWHLNKFIIYVYSIIENMIFLFTIILHF
jgi:hypothetical protein